MPAPTLQRLLLASALGTGSTPANRRALELARRHGAALHVLHVLEPAESFATVRERLRALLGQGPQSPEHVDDAATRDARARLAESFGHEHTPAGPVEVAVRSGTSAEQITRYAADIDADLVIVGATGGETARGVGTTAERVVRRVGRPALVVRDAEAEPYVRVVVGVDFSDSSRHALQFAAALAPGSDILAAHASDAVFETRLRWSGASDPLLERYRAQVLDLLGQDLDSVIGELELGSAVVRASVRQGAPTKVLLELAAITRAQLVVVGGAGAGGIEQLLLGSVATHVMREAPQDILVVP